MGARWRRGAAGSAIAVSLCLLSPTAVAQEAERTHASEHFEITWVHDPASPHAPDLTDEDGDDVPDAVERTLAAFESVRSFHLGTLGYSPPPVEGRYQLYVAQPQGDGYTHPGPGGTPRSRPSFIVIPPSRVRMSTPDAEIGTWAAHEYLHAIQMGYHAETHPWIREATATWVQDVYDDDADSNHRLLQYFVPQPGRSLTTAGGRFEYGAFLFIQYLVERHAGGDPDLVREIWEELEATTETFDEPGAETIFALERVLERRGVTLDDAWGEFLLWRWRIGHFEEGKSYREAVAHTGWPSLGPADPVRSESCRLETGSLRTLSGEYDVLRPHRTKGPRGATALVSVTGPPGATGFAVLKERRTPADERLLRLGPEGVAQIEVPWDARNTRRLTIGLGNGTYDRPPMGLGYSVRILGQDRVAASPPEGPPTTIFPNGVSLSGSVTCRGTGASDARVLVTETDAAGETREFDVETGVGGTWRLFVRPDANATYTAEVVDPLLSPAEAEPFDLGVRVGVTLRPVDDRVPRGQPVEVTGETLPAHAGVPVIVEFRRPERQWRVGTEVLTGPDGAYAGSFTLPAKGVWELTARVPSTGDDDHLPGALVTKVVVEVVE